VGQEHIKVGAVRVLHLEHAYRPDPDAVPRGHRDLAEELVEASALLARVNRVEAKLQVLLPRRRRGGTQAIRDDRDGLPAGRVAFTAARHHRKDADVQDRSFHLGSPP
jgi:hypothetical protein